MLPSIFRTNFRFPVGSTVSQWYCLNSIIRLKLKPICKVEEIYPHKNSKPIFSRSYGDVVFVTFTKSTWIASNSVWTLPTSSQNTVQTMLFSSPLEMCTLRTIFKIKRTWVGWVNKICVKPVSTLGNRWHLVFTKLQFMITSSLLRLSYSFPDF